MSIIQWSEELATGHPLIDKQHRKLVELIIELHSALEKQSPLGVVSRLLEELTAFAKIHFDTEERLMDRCRYPGLIEHRKRHDDLMDKSQKILRAYKTGTITLSSTLSEFFGNWICNHIMIEDKTFANYLQHHSKQV